MDARTTSMVMDHSEAELLLPFLANGSLVDTERAQVQAHARTCLRCRKALAEERAWVQAFRSNAVPAQRADDTLDQVLARARKMPTRTSAARRRFTLAAPLRKVRAYAPHFALAAALMLAIGVAWQSAGPAPDNASFHTLTRPGQTGVGQSTVFVVFEPAVAMSTINELLRAVGGEVVAGPNSVGAYTLRVPGSVSATVAALEAAPEVQFVAPALDAAGRSAGVPPK